MAIVLPNATSHEDELVQILSGGGVWRPAVELALDDPAYREFGREPKDSDANKSIQRRRQAEASNETTYWGVVEKDEGYIVGLLELKLANAELGWLEAGYWIVEGQRGQGFAPAALRLMTDWVEDETEAERMDLLIHPDNKSSRRVAEKCGYVKRDQVIDRELGPDALDAYSWHRSGPTETA